MAQRKKHNDLEVNQKLESVEEKLKWKLETSEANRIKKVEEMIRNRHAAAESLDMDEQS